jgi:hypothetical protein
MTSTVKAIFQDCWFAFRKFYMVHPYPFLSKSMAAEIDHLLREAKEESLTVAAREFQRKVEHLLHFETSGHRDRPMSTDGGEYRQWGVVLP